MAQVFSPNKKEITHFSNFSRDGIKHAIISVARKLTYSLVRVEELANGFSLLVGDREGKGPGNEVRHCTFPSSSYDPLGQEESNNMGSRDQNIPWVTLQVVFIPSAIFF